MTVYMDVAQELLTCYEGALTAPGFPNPPASVCLRHGDQVVPSLGTQADECCSGLAWVRIVTVEPLPDALPNPGCITSERRVTLEMGAVHCLPWGTTEAPATCEQWTAVALQADAYHNAMEQALCCLRGELSKDVAEQIVPGAYLPTGPDANCVGGTMQVVIDTSCGCTAGS